MEYKEMIRNAILGLAVGDALGVPVEFYKRVRLKMSPVTDMQEGGFHNQPKGTWSDDTSMTLATMDGLIKSIGKEPDYDIIMQNFCDWFYKGKFAVDGNVFDWGGTCETAIEKYSQTHNDPIHCGNWNWDACGNGSLMRIIPMAFWIDAVYGDEGFKSRDAVNTVFNISALTHGSLICKCACVEYVQYAIELMKGADKIRAFYDKFMTFVDNNGCGDGGAKVPYRFRRFEYDDYIRMPESEIRSSGYVIDTLEASVWCFLNTDNYKDCVLKAVNLGDDTDTVAAVAGGLAGIYYGIGGEKGIPEKWLSELREKQMIIDLCDAYASRLEEI